MAALRGGFFFCLKIMPGLHDPADDADGEILYLLRRVGGGLVYGGVVADEGKASGALMDLFYRGFIAVDQHDRDLSIFDLFLLPHNERIAVVDCGLHALACDAQREVFAAPCLLLRYFLPVDDVFLGPYWDTGGQVAEDGDFHALAVRPCGRGAPSGRVVPVHQVRARRSPHTADSTHLIHAGHFLTQASQQNYDFNLPPAFKYDQPVSKPAVAPPVQMTPPANASTQQKQTADNHNRDMRDMYQLAMLQQMNGNQGQQDGGILGAAQQIANVGLMKAYMGKMFPQQ